ncbi:hypothetical protein FIBSPDRAFT_262193 [Athelia psychrophila]|uniref:Uncharacterized protein n=1 Tax=Athelia psychrophila TaxID=1759441 RepID=A0A165XFV2_9AGAM|nr:hypothetical protein FIBSPDRAFT_262193 [Fibularhizoctonia sp. CBS 109695]
MSPSLSSQMAPLRLPSPWYRLLDHPPLKVWSDVLASNDQMPFMALLCSCAFASVHVSTHPSATITSPRPRPHPRPRVGPIAPQVTRLGELHDGRSTAFAPRSRPPSMKKLLGWIMVPAVPIDKRISEMLSSWSRKR